jgi:DnaK suppressor protein
MKKSPDTYNAYRQQLLDLRAGLLQADQTGREAERTVELDQSRVGRLSRMDALQAQAMSIEAGQRRRLLLRKVEGALERLEHGEYGVCLHCDEPINPLRLNADPTATLCIECASAAGN